MLTIAPMLAPLGLVVGLGGLPEVPLLPVDEPEGVEMERVPVGTAAPTKEPVRGPGPAVAAAPDPLRAPVGTPGSVLEAAKLESKATAED